MATTIDHNTLLALLHIAGPMSNGHDVFAHWASTRPPVPAVGSLTPNQILDLYLREMALGVDAGSATAQSSPMGANWTNLQGKMDETVDKYVELIAKANTTIAALLSPARVASLQEIFADFLDTAQNDIAGLGKFTVLALPPMLVLAGLVPASSRWAELAAPGLGSAKMLHALRIPELAMPFLAEQLKLTELELENFLCELWRKINPGSTQKMDYYIPALRVFRSKDGWLELQTRPTTSNVVQHSGWIVAIDPERANLCNAAAKGLSKLKRQASAESVAELATHAAQKKAKKKRKRDVADVNVAVI